MVGAKKWDNRMLESGMKASGKKRQGEEKRTGSSTEEREGGSTKTVCVKM